MRIAFISDIHSNIHAFEKVLEELEKENVNKIYCCGDIVGYNAFPSECIKLVKEKIDGSVMGNHDYATLTGETGWFNEYGVEGISYTRKVISDEDMNFLKNLKTHIYLDVDDLKIYITHGSPRDEIFEYVFPDSNDDFLLVLADIAKADVLVFGHTHLPMERRIKRKIFLNPGSVGQPRDGNPKASFLIFDTRSKEACFKRIEYDIDKAAKAIIDNDLPRFLAQRLYLGI